MRYEFGLTDTFHYAPQCTIVEKCIVINDLKTMHIIAYKKHFSIKFMFLKMFENVPIKINREILIFYKCLRFN